MYSLTDDTDVSQIADYKASSHPGIAYAMIFVTYENTVMSE